MTQATKHKTPNRTTQPLRNRCKIVIAAIARIDYNRFARVEL